MDTQKEIAKEIVARKANYISDGTEEAINFVQSVINKHTLCFDKRVGLFTDDYKRATFWRGVISEINLLKDKRHEKYFN